MYGVYVGFTVVAGIKGVGTLEFPEGVERGPLLGVREAGGWAAEACVGCGRSEAGAGREVRVVEGEAGTGHGAGALSRKDGGGEGGGEEGENGGELVHCGCCETALLSRRARLSCVNESFEK